MAIIRAAAQEANIPFWTFVQTCSFNSGMRIPTEADILWQVNTALAYGAKGIQYFTGVLPTNGDGTGEIFNGAMFDRDGNRTVIYDYVKTANDQIKAIDEVLMCSRSEGVIVAGGDAVGGRKPDPRRRYSRKSTERCSPSPRRTRSPAVSITRAGTPIISPTIPCWRKMPSLSPLTEKSRDFPFSGRKRRTLRAVRSPLR